MTKVVATGKVVRAFGNLLHVAFEGDIRQGEVAMIDLGNISLKAEVIEIVGSEAKLQVYEDTRGIKLGTHVEFSTLLLEAELGPGLLTSIFDGLQNPLENVAKATGLFLTRGTYLPALDYVRRWDYNPIAKIGDVLSRQASFGSLGLSNRAPIRSIRWSPRRLMSKGASMNLKWFRSGLSNRRYLQVGKFLCKR